MFTVHEAIAIEHPNGTWTQETIIRLHSEAEPFLVASNGRDYPTDGGKDLGNTWPKTRLHAWSDESATKIRHHELRQRIVGIIALAALRGQ